MIISSLYNVNRDTKKYGSLHWWEFMTRWLPKYRKEQQVNREEGLKAALISRAEKDKRKRAREAMKQALGQRNG